MTNYFIKIKINSSFYGKYCTTLFFSQMHICFEILSSQSAGVAQQVEQLICNQQVAGSSPIASSSIWLYNLEGYPSGQREQTVNLPAKPTEVRILPPPSGNCIEQKFLEDSLQDFFNDERE